MWILQSCTEYYVTGKRNPHNTFLFEEMFGCPYGNFEQQDGILEPLVIYYYYYYYYYYYCITLTVYIIKGSRNAIWRKWEMNGRY